MRTMKLSNAITAATAAIGISVVSAVPSAARNGWVYVGKGEREGITHYIKYRRHEGPLVRFEWRTANTSSPWHDFVFADCNSWSYKTEGSNDWSDALPGTMADAALEEVCSYRPIVNKTYRPNRTLPTIASHGGYESCDARTDEIFWRRYPSLRGQKLTSSDGRLAEEWHQINRSICRF